MTLTTTRAIPILLAAALLLPAASCETTTDTGAADATGDAVVVTPEG